MKTKRIFVTKDQAQEAVNQVVHLLWFHEDDIRIRKSRFPCSILKSGWETLSEHEQQMVLGYMGSKQKDREGKNLWWCYQGYGEDEEEIVWIYHGLPAIRVGAKFIEDTYDKWGGYYPTLTFYYVNWYSCPKIVKKLIEDEKLVPHY